jgi:NADH pyrophosphatase NudC (nudix superfamily)
VAEDDLVPFGCLSEAEAHTIHYPNGDVTHCFALCFLASRWSGEPTPNEEEIVEAGFFDRQMPPRPLHAPTDRACARAVWRPYLASGAFQVR